MTACTIIAIDGEGDLEVTLDFSRVPCVGEFIESAEGWPGDYALLPTQVKKVSWVPQPVGPGEAMALLEVEIAKPDEQAIG